MTPKMHARCLMFVNSSDTMVLKLGNEVYFTECRLTGVEKMHFHLEILALPVVAPNIIGALPQSF